MWIMPIPSHVKVALLSDSLVIAALLTTIGCTRTATRFKEVPRVDLELEGAGNRGYLRGTPPEAPPPKPTRQMVQMDVELSSALFGPSGAAPSQAKGSPEAGLTLPQEGAAGPEDDETYVVQPGDSLWSIAEQPEVYGEVTRWRTIFDANRDLLDTPNDLQAGMTLRIPRGEMTEPEGETTSQKK